MNNINILVSASVPSKERSEEFRKVKDAQSNIEEAIIAVSRSIFFAGGRIIMGGHPSISPLIAMVSTEFQHGPKDGSAGKETKQKPLKIYQSRAFEGFLPDSTFVLYNSGFAEIQWVNAVNNEKFNPEIKGPQCRNSLAQLRSMMINEDLDAMVCIGGMEGVIEEFSLFRKMKSRKPIFLFKNTGGAAYNLATNKSEDIMANNFIKVYEDRPLEKSADLRTDIELQSFPIFPYTVRAAEMIDEIIKRKRDDPESFRSQ